VTIELYHNGMSTCSQKVRVTLAEKGQDFISHHFNLRAGDQHAPEYLAINPNGVVPTIIHDGRVVYESAVVDEYLDDIFPDPPLRSADPYERARMRLWVKQLDEGLHAASATISACIAFRYQFMEGKTEAELKKTLDGYVDPVKRERMTENVLAGVESRFFKPAIGRIVKMVDDMQAALSEGIWMAGNSYSLADIAFAPYVTRVAHLQQDWLFDTRPRVAGWLERMRARPAYRKGMVEWFNPDFLALMEEKGGENIGGVKSVLEAG
jgi:glutathione S-transferase